MFFSSFAVLFLIFSIGMQSANSQFYVDIEHALPRFGKRNDATIANKYIHKNEQTERTENLNLMKKIQLIYKLFANENMKN